MDQQKMLDLTMQVRQNQSELTEFLSGMDSWEKDIKKKDDNLKSTKTEQVADMPPVRNSVYKKKTKKKIKENAENGKAKRISGRDFRAWDKFDVDKALQEIDDQNSSNSEYETDEDWEIERKKQQALMHKEEGNQYFKDGQYDQAIQCYTKGVQCDSTNAILLANRAMALIKQAKYAIAEVDCTDAIAIDPSYVKAYSRRATARHKLNKLNEAKEDYLQVVKFEAKNKLAISELEKIEMKLNPPQPDPEGLVFPVCKSPEQRSKKPLKRLEIEEIGEDEGGKINVLKTVGHSDVTQKIVEKDSKLFEAFTKHVNDNPGNLNNSDSKELAPEHSVKDVKTSKTILPSLDTSQVSKYVEEIGSPRKSTSPRTGIPQNSYQFQADWKLMKDDSSSFFAYLQKIPPKLYPKLIGENLEADILTSILCTLNAYQSSFENVFEHLKCLVSVKRFSMTVMFLSSTDKQIIKDLFTAVDTSGSVDKTELVKLSKAYQL